MRRAVFILVSIHFGSSKQLHFKLLAVDVYMREIRFMPLSALESNQYVNQRYITWIFMNDCINFRKMARWQKPAVPAPRIATT